MSDRGSWHDSSRVTAATGMLLALALLVVLLLARPTGSVTPAGAHAHPGGPAGAELGCAPHELVRTVVPTYAGAGGDATGVEAIERHLAERYPGIETSAVSIVTALDSTTIARVLDAGLVKAELTAAPVAGEWEVVGASFCNDWAKERDR